MRAIRHFIVTWENGKMLVSRAREIVPKRTYEIIQDPEPRMESYWKFTPESEQRIRLNECVETRKKKSADF